jgi:hypothetical protein
MDSGLFLGVVMLSDRAHLHIANFFLVWIRRDDTRDRLATNTQRATHEELVRLVRRKGTEGQRIAAELTRWVYSGERFIMEDVRWMPDDFCRRQILRFIRDAAEKAGAEDAGDISNDVTAVSFPMINHTVNAWGQNMKAFVKTHQSLGKSAAETFTALKLHLQQSGDDWSAAM